MYRSIDTETWTDPWFEELDPPAKLVFLYLITNHHVSAAGTCEMTLKRMESETGLTQARIEALLPALAPRVLWWPEHRVLWVRNFYRRQKANTNAGNFRTSAQRAIEGMPDDVQEAILREYPELTSVPAAPPRPIPMHDGDATMHGTDAGMHGDGIPMASPSHADGITNPSLTVPVPVTETEQSREEQRGSADKPRPARRAVPIPQPFELTSEMDEWAMTALGMEHNLVVRETTKFINHFLGNGRPMKDWRATWENWLIRAQENTSQGRWTGRSHS